MPEGYANRGEYVSEVARANHGAQVRAEKAAGAAPETAAKAKEKAGEKVRGAGAANGHAKGGRP